MRRSTSWPRLRRTRTFLCVTCVSPWHIFTATGTPYSSTTTIRSIHRSLVFLTYITKSIRLAQLGQAAVTASPHGPPHITMPSL
ncbi:hypothetical protein BJX96DRAFT_102381 [Aspergillus floccosus]